MGIRRSKSGILFVVIAVAALLLVPVTSSFAAKDKIVWKSSGHGPASDPSQIFHDKLFLPIKRLMLLIKVCCRWVTLPLCTILTNGRQPV